MVLTIFSCAVGYLYVFLGETSVQVFGPPLNCVVGILLYILNLKPIAGLWFVNISAILSVVLSLLCEHPLTHEVFNFLRSSVSNFHCFLCLWCHTFGPTTQAKVKRIQHHQTSSIQFSCSVMSNSATPWTAARQASLSITNSQSLLKLMSVESMMPPNHLILCRSLFLPPSIFHSVSVFSNESLLRIRWPNYWSFSISPSNIYSGLISFRMDWLDLLAVQGTLKSLLQHHSSKASILQCSAFVMV